MLTWSVPPPTPVGTLCIITDPPHMQGSVTAAGHLPCSVRPVIQGLPSAGSIVAALDNVACLCVGCLPKSRYDQMRLAGCHTAQMCVYAGYGRGSHQQPALARLC